MSITVKPMHPDFVTEISGVDLARPLTPADRDAIEDAINRYAIVVFHDQKLTDEQELLMHLADISIDVFSAESAALRAQAASAAGGGRASLHVDAARVFVNDAALRIDASARQAENTALAGGGVLSRTRAQSESTLRPRSTAPPVTVAYGGTLRSPQATASKNQYVTSELAASCESMQWLAVYR